MTEQTQTGLGCACRFDINDEPINRCKYHTDLQTELDAAREALNNTCACTHDGRGNLDTECQEHERIRTELDSANARLADEAFLCMEAQSPCRTYLRMKDDLDAANARIEELEAALRTTLRNTVHESDEQLLRIIEDAPHAEFCESTLTRGLPCNCFKSEAKALMAQTTASLK